MPLRIVKSDIVEMDVDVMVSSTSIGLKKRNVSCSIVFEPQEGQDRQLIRIIEPVWKGGKSEESLLLRECYTISLELAIKHGCKSIAFPLLASGISGYPKEVTLQIALDAIKDFLHNHEIDVYLAIYDDASFAINQALFADIKRYIADNYAEEHIEIKYQMGAISKSLDRCLKRLPQELPETFSEMLIRLIHEKGLKESEVYKRANIDRQLFSKIRRNHDYQPSKPTAIALAIALCLTLDETIDLLGRAGYTLSISIMSDVIIKYFIELGKYDIFEINSALFDFNQTTLN